VSLGTAVSAIGRSRHGRPPVPGAHREALHSHSNPTYRTRISRAREGWGGADAVDLRFLDVERKEIRAVLFDLGGVLTPDPWQALVLTPGSGIADRLGISRGRAAIAAERLWNEYVVRADANEGDYWREFGDLVGASIPRGLVSSVERELLRPNPEASDVLHSLVDAELRVGVVSDNTTFWYDKQARITGLDRVADPDLLFLSFRFGVTKEAVPGLLEIAATSVAPNATLVVDDRTDHVDRARELRFHAVRYSPDWSDSLSAAVRG
jgi:FMN phosphatase YigB (HAD superfamily)